MQTLLLLPLPLPLADVPQPTVPLLPKLLRCDALRSAAGRSANVSLQPVHSGV
jgi:hypothetical protein